MNTQRIQSTIAMAREEGMPAPESTKEKILSGIGTLRAAFPKSEAIQITADQTIDLVTQENIPMGNIIRGIERMSTFMTAEEQQYAARILIKTINQVRRDIAFLRNPDTPTYPDRIIQHSMHKFNGAPWYLAGYNYDDPGAGTTGGPHLAFIRTPQSVVREGQDFPRDLFAKNRVFAGKRVPVRVHSECLLGDIAVGQSRCDCGAQFRAAMHTINNNNEGVVVYLRQEGRGMGLRKKLQALERSEGRVEGKWTGEMLNTDQAMLAEGHQTADERDYKFVAGILRGLGMHEISLMTHNPAKVAGLAEHGFDVEQVEAASIARTMEALREMLWKMLTQGYNIPFAAVEEMLHEQVQKIKDGKTISAPLRKAFLNVISAIEEGTHKNIPEEVADLLINIKKELEAQEK